MSTTPPTSEALEALSTEQLIELGVETMAARKGVTDDEGKAAIRRTLQSLPPSHVKIFIQSSPSRCRD
jgi:hypothetical protein